MKTIRLLFPLMLMCISLSVFSQKEITIEEIIKNPGVVLEENIVTEGVVIQFIPETSTSNAHYLLEGKYGGIIKVKTAESEPIKNSKYEVTGTVYSENGRPFIHEGSKKLLKSEEEEFLLYIIIGASVLLLFVIIFFVFLRKKSKPAYSKPEQIRRSPKKQPSSTPKTDDNMGYSSEDDDFKTIKFSSADSDPKTMTFIPGKLELISGEDKGKTFRIAGYPTPDGSIVTIGRKAIKGDRSYAHIMIDGKFKTVSGLQAELVYSNGKLSVKNHSETNPTQVDGIELSSNKSVEFKKGSTMRTGELEFKYID